MIYWSELLQGLMSHIMSFKIKHLKPMMMDTFWDTEEWNFAS